MYEWVGVPCGLPLHYAAVIENKVTCYVIFDGNRKRAIVIIPNG